MKSYNLYNALFALLLFLLLGFNLKQSSTATPVIDPRFKVLKVNPSITDNSITAFDNPHVIIYDPTIKTGKLLVFLPGTGGTPEHASPYFFNTVVEQGYRLIALSYFDTPAVAQVCTGSNLAANENCAEEMRMRRVYGTNSFSLIKDSAQDAIVNRLLKLLTFLSKNYPKAGWDQFLDNGSLKWGQLAFAGQSQGGGMSEFIGQHQSVARIISFSGGWDFSAKGKIANWYNHKNVTPPELWFGVYHKEEPTADIMLKIYQALRIPPGHIYALDAPVRKGSVAHSEGLGNPANKPIWIEMLGKGN